MVDLPLHAAQVASIKHFNDPAFGFSQQFKLNLFTPYLTGIYAALLLSYPFGVFYAIKIMVTLALLGIPVSLYLLLKETDGDPWLSLIGFPLGFSMSFFWGFLSYQVAVPIGIFMVALAWRHSEQPNIKTALALLICCFFLFFSHGMVLMVCGPISFLVLFFSYPLKTAWKRVFPIMLPLPLILAWLHFTQSREFRFHEATAWGYQGFHRLKELLSSLISLTFDRPAEKATMLLIAAILIGAGGLRLRKKTVLPLLLAVLFFCFSPYALFGIYYTYQRLGVFVAVTLLLCFAPTRSGWRRNISHFLIVAVAVGWMSFLLQRFRAFNLEARDFDRVVKVLKPNMRLLTLMFYKGEQHAGETFTHFGGWYQAEKGGVLGFSFALYYNSAVRYQEGKEPVNYYVAHQLLWDPKSWNYEQHGNFDYFLVRSLTDRTGEMKKSSKGKLRLTNHYGTWWLYER